MTTGRRTPLREFLADESAGGIVLLLATMVALIWANVATDSYADVWHFVPNVPLDLDLHAWVNDALMAIFFFVVGLEIKRELVTGELRDPRAALLPMMAAVGGVVVPAAIFIALTRGADVGSGWAIPTATDIAFAVGVLGLLGSRVSAGAKLLLLTIAIVDDLIAIVVIAAFYADGISFAWLAAAVGGLVIVRLMYRFGITRTAWFIVPWIAVWYAVFESGVHATIAGVALALVVPASPIRGREVLHALEDRLHNVSAFVIVPLFALANAGIVLSSDTVQAAIDGHVATAIAVALVVGNPLGIAVTILALTRAGVARLPDGVRAAQVWGIGALGGIGFTVSLFIADLAYDEQLLVDESKLGILVGSLVSGVLGAAILLLAGRRRR